MFNTTEREILEVLFCLRLGKEASAIPCGERLLDRVPKGPGVLVQSAGLV